MLLWLWHRPAAVALIPPLAREPPNVTGVALKKKQAKIIIINKKKKEKKKESKTKFVERGCGFTTQPVTQVRTGLLNTAATNHMWLFKLKFKFKTIKNILPESH